MCCLSALESVCVCLCCVSISTYICAHVCLSVCVFAYCVTVCVGGCTLACEMFVMQVYAARLCDERMFVDDVDADDVVCVRVCS